MSAQYRDGCILCFAGQGHPVSHPGDHLVQPVYGGRAMTAIDEDTDPEVVEELVWVSLEQALEDAGWDLPGMVALAADVAQLLWLGKRVPFTSSLNYAGHAIEWQERSDEHLEGDASTAEVVCTITAPLTAITQEQLEPRMLSHR